MVTMQDFHMLQVVYHTKSEEEYWALGHSERAKRTRSVGECSLIEVPFLVMRIDTRQFCREQAVLMATRREIENIDTSQLTRDTILVISHPFTIVPLHHSSKLGEIPEAEAFDEWCAHRTTRAKSQPEHFVEFLHPDDVDSETQSLLWNTVALPYGPKKGYSTTTFLGYDGLVSKIKPHQHTKIATVFGSRNTPLATRNSRGTIVCESLSKNEWYAAQLVSEVVRRGIHPNFYFCHQFKSSPLHGELVMQRYAGDALSRSRGVPARMHMNMFCQVLAAVLFGRKVGVVHNDAHLRNVFHAPIEGFVFRGESMKHKVTLCYHLGQGQYLVLYDQSELFVLGDFEYASVFDFCKQQALVAFGPIHRREEHFCEKHGISADFDATYDIKTLVINVAKVLEDDLIPSNNRLTSRLCSFAREIKVLSATFRPFLQNNDDKEDRWLASASDVEIAKRLLPADFLTRTPPPEEPGACLHIDLEDVESLCAVEDLKIAMTADDSAAC